MLVLNSKIPSLNTQTKIDWRQAATPTHICYLNNTNLSQRAILMHICYLINTNSSQKSHPHAYLLPNQCKFELESHPHAYLLPNQYKFESENLRLSARFMARDLNSINLWRPSRLPRLEGGSDSPRGGSPAPETVQEMCVCRSEWPLAPCLPGPQGSFFICSSTIYLYIDVYTLTIMTRQIGKELQAALAAGLRHRQTCKECNAYRSEWLLFPCLPGPAAALSPSFTLHLYLDVYALN